MLTKVTPKYTVIQSEYVSRLVNTFKFVLYEIVDDRLVRSIEPTDIMKKKNDDDCDMSITPLFVYDWRYGPYIPNGACGLWASPNLDPKYHKDIIKIVKTNITGIVVFVNTEANEDFLGYAQQLDYCYWGSLISDGEIYFDGGQLFAVWYVVDAESG